jgi:Arc/MetJ-type ribon-helix-helix transcriptional regulator
MIDKVKQEIISLKLPEEFLKISTECARTLNLSRSAYIREAIARMNQETYSQIKFRRMAKASLKVRKESMRVNREFSEIEQDIEA